MRGVKAALGGGGERGNLQHHAAVQEHIQCNTIEPCPMISAAYQVIEVHWSTTDLLELICRGQTSPGHTNGQAVCLCGELPPGPQHHLDKSGSNNNPDIPAWRSLNGLSNPDARPGSICTLVNEWPKQIENEMSHLEVLHHTALQDVLVP
jgi:hypothetical protein